ncbi:polyprenyl synthetase family protein [Dissulfurirhabdus thermomarina]|uniref:Polyprenyl synthetase family protein n=1 Tax=Dissulfurirhabdus thermomarina TaxID=1765737 RepID=A0A6N9TQX7_DISTH|nr:farnesyl diphosphate synthase [Dissulfurirhabdus thermomarina]NDY42144.1 polyprenyl synthetase family protein [Dissulfurirhabdus thermomarina]NMX23078.1 polyprenyl synthetase family protein [Dissulfurirhabdus thermomarina]
MNRPSQEFDIRAYLERQRDRVEAALADLLPEIDGAGAPVCEAMRYSLTAGGKRIRPILLLAAARAVGAPETPLLPVACALECIHTYSLVHDDLPAMDDDDLRRGRPTCHKRFGEALAILAGDGLLTFAFELLARPSTRREVDPARLLEAIHILAHGAGVSGMVGGQAADVLMEGREVDASTLAYIHQKKTGALIQAAVRMGAILGGGSEREVLALGEYGRFLGLAFQVVDDLLDVEGDPAVTGKPVGSDARRQKATYPALFGVEQTRRRAAELLDQALAALEGFDEKADPLRAIARFVVERDR